MVDYWQMCFQQRSLYVLMHGDLVMCNISETIQRSCLKIFRCPISHKKKVLTHDADASRPLTLQNVTFSLMQFCSYHNFLYGLNCDLYSQHSLELC